MKTLKLISAGLFVTAIMILVGCSDQITSSGVEAPHSVTSVTSTVEEAVQINKDSYRIQIRLKPFRNYKIEASAAGFKDITSIDINEVINDFEDKYVQDCRDLSIYGSGSMLDYPISCHSKGLNLKSVTIENLSAEFITLDIEVNGTKLKATQVVNQE